MVIHRITNKKTGIKTWLLFAICFLSFYGVNAQPSGKPLSPDGAKGEALFIANCASCHSMNAKSTGPALSGVTKKHSKEWLQKWIRNNEKLRASGDAEAIAVYNENGKVAMTVFENLSEGEINNIISYLGDWAPAARKAGPAGDLPQSESKFYSSNTLYILLALIVILAVVAYILARTKKTLRAAALEKNLVESTAKEVDPNSKWAQWKKRSNPTIVTLSIIATLGLILFLYGFYFGVTEVGVQRGYAPEQPIKFSHKIHAGDYSIDCKYCHTTVEKSKQASVPSVNTCFNCHKGVQARKDEYGGEISPEIKKIYAALDYDAETQKFGSNPKPVRWIRVHNLPDHAYFNHSQHVKVAGLECQKCHGPIQTMDVVQQHATLQMGWCINCHREKGIDVEHNPYYEKLHNAAKADIAKNGKNSKYYSKDGKLFITVAQNGGLECGKCHY